MRTALYSALTVVTFGVLTLAPANANWSCIGPAVACSDSAPVSSYNSRSYNSRSYRRSTERFDSKRAPRRHASTKRTHKPTTVATREVPTAKVTKAEKPVDPSRNVAQNGYRASAPTTTAKVELPERKPASSETKVETVASYRVTSSQSGMASYYGSESGSQTASGQHFNPGAMTAAHRTLPFGTKVRVTNKRNGKSVVVTINDRGPFVRGRIIDVSTGAAGVLGMRAAGVAPVLVERLGG